MRVLESHRCARFGKAFLSAQEEGRLPVMSVFERYRRKSDGKAS